MTHSERRRGEKEEVTCGISGILPLGAACDGEMSAFVPDASGAEGQINRGTSDVTVSAGVDGSSLPVCKKKKKKTDLLLGCFCRRIKNGTNLIFHCRWWRGDKVSHKWRNLKR